MSSVKVAVRVRPFNKREIGTGFKYSIISRSKFQNFENFKNMNRFETREKTMEQKKSLIWRITPPILKIRGVLMT